MSFEIKTYIDKNFPSFNKPMIVGYFSLNGQKREYSQDFKQLKYYYDKYKKHVRFDLNEGMKQVIRKLDGLDEKINYLLRWIIDNYKTIKAKPDSNRWFIYFFI